MTSAIRLEIRDNIAFVTFNRPERLNVIDLEMARAFLSVMRTIAADQSVRVIAINGEGRGFVAGGDLASFRAATDKSEIAKVVLDAIHEGLKLLAQSTAISLCIAQGPIAGAGVSILAVADLAIAADNATFNMAYGRVAVPPDCGGTWALPRLVGLRKAMELTLLSETIDAVEAQRIGLLNRVVPLASLNEESARLAKRLATGAPMAMAKTKALMRNSFVAEMNDQLDAEQAAFMACANTEDFIEGLDAFFEKRRPYFTGR
jgi:2-(1,2-epoxy-1,2-dihydrophenyl)acetyl-CoA isomerase